MKKNFFHLAWFAIGTLALTSCKGAPIAPTVETPVLDKSGDTSSSNSEMSLPNLPECVPSTTWQCPNLSGHYSDDENPNHLESLTHLIQPDCFDVRIEYGPEASVVATMNWKTDGMTYTIGEWRQTSRWQGDCLVNLIDFQTGIKRTVYERLPTGGLKEIIDEIHTNGRKDHWELTYRHL
jgi:hypothetical protein